MPSLGLRSVPHNVLENYRLKYVGIADLPATADRILIFQPVDNRLNRRVSGTRRWKSLQDFSNRCFPKGPENFHDETLQLRKSWAFSLGDRLPNAVAFCFHRRRLAFRKLVMWIWRKNFRHCFHIICLGAELSTLD